MIVLLRFSSNMQKSVQLQMAEWRLALFSARILRWSVERKMQPPNIIHDWSSWWIGLAPITMVASCLMSVTKQSIWSRRAVQSQQRLECVCLTFKSNCQKHAWFMHPQQVNLFMIIDHLYKFVLLLNGNSILNGKSFIYPSKMVPFFKKNLWINATLITIGASEPRNMAYMVRLGLWGEGTPFRTFPEFLTTLEKR